MTRSIECRCLLVVDDYLKVDMQVIVNRKGEFLCCCLAGCDGRRVGQECPDRRGGRQRQVSMEGGGRLLWNGKNRV